jgi:glycosyltransferase involved in cell wall biosynthesis
MLISLNDSSSLLDRDLSKPTPLLHLAAPFCKKAIDLGLEDVSIKSPEAVLDSTASLHQGKLNGPAEYAENKVGYRILVVVRGAESYGTKTCMLGLLESLTARGADVRCYGLGEGRLLDEARTLPHLPIEVDPVAPPRYDARRVSRVTAYARTMRASLGVMRRLSAFLRRMPCDAIIFCEHGLVLQIGAVARKSGSRAFWLMPNDVGKGYPLDLNRRLYAFSFCHLRMVPVANSEHTRQTLGRGAMYAAKIDLGINPDRLATSSSVTPSIADACNGEIRLLVMARLVEGKGQLVLLKAVLSNDAFRNIHLDFCGGPLGTDYAERLMREAAKGGASDRLRLHGPVSDIGRYYGAADVVVNARLDPEPFGLSVVEAMMMGKPVLAHVSGGPADTVLDGVTGWHVAEPTVEAFATGLFRMLADRPKWAQMGHAAMERARRLYTHHMMTDQLMSVIEMQLQRR